MVSFERDFVKYILFIFNLIFAISGIGIITAGAIILWDVADFHRFMDNEFLAPPIVLIVAGSIIFIVAFLGCFGAIRESYKLLIAFSVCLLIIFVIELAVIIAVVVYKNDFGETFKTTLKQSMANYTQNEVEKIAWDNAQKKLDCCGVEGPIDWQGQELPYSCCHLKDEIKDPFSEYCINMAAGKYLYQIGCFEKLKIKINDHSKVLIGVGIGIALVEIVGIILACWLASMIKNENEREK